ncbi:hypothetical protein [uncultured Clostridium sp.]|uniref:hypothetical protein n=1 Tax=uncultured Clostridium sp. TaxID=59620 RepID=UPI0025D004FB|nr:hypothetical protein [uncultured Clostridium sp.]
MDMFRRKLTNEEDHNEEKRKMLREENVGAKDVIALILAAFELLLPFILIGVIVYILVLLVLTKFWL